MPYCSILLILFQLTFQSILKHHLLIPTSLFDHTLYLLDHLRKEQWKRAKYSGCELLYVLHHPCLTIGTSRVSVTHESEAAPEYDREAKHDLLENVAEGDVRKEPV